MKPHVIYDTSNIDHHGPSIHSGHYTASINCCKKNHCIATITQLRSLELLAAKTPLLHMSYYMNWLTHDIWTRTGGWEFDRSHDAGASSPSHWQQVEEQAPKPVGWIMCFLLMAFVPVQKLCVNIYIYIYAFLYEFCFLWFTNCVLLSVDNSLIPGCLWLLAFVLNYNTLILGIWWSTIPHLPGCFCPWTFFSEYRIQHGAIGPLYVTSGYSTWIFCRGVAGFVTDCPCNVWCRGLTTCLLHVGPPFGNRFLNTSWAVGLTYSIVYLIFFVFWHMQFI